MEIQKKKLIAFDLDGTLTESKSLMDSQMAGLLSRLLKVKKVAVMSGGTFNQFQKQFVRSLKCSRHQLENLYLFPTCGSSFYRYQDGWYNVYKEELSENEKEKIINALTKALEEVKFSGSEQLFGDLIQDRGTQISFSALGQEAPVELKKRWDPKGIKRLKIKKALEHHIPEFEIRIGGSTSIDITRKGIDKAYGIAQIEKHLGIQKEEIIFIGDALFPGGNDYPVKETGVECIETRGPEETKRIIKSKFL